MSKTLVERATAEVSSDREEAIIRTVKGKLEFIDCLEEKKRQNDIQIERIKKQITDIENGDYAEVDFGRVAVGGKAVGACTLSNGVTVYTGLSGLSASYK